MATTESERVMTHDELLAKIKTGNEFVGIKYAPDSHTFALRAVVELHNAGNGDASRCEACYMGFDCPTIQAIEKELR